MITDYDAENDILYIHKGFEKEERFKGNIDAGDLILDMSTKGRVAGIEILNATSYLKEFDVDKELLENLKKADFEATHLRSSVTISLKLTGAREQKMKIAVANLS